MFEKPKRDELAVHVDLDDLLGPLGYKEKEQVSPHVLQQILAEKEHCVSLLKPQYMSAIFPADAVKETFSEDDFLRNILVDSTVAAAAFCTVGPAIDAYIDDCFAAGEFFKGMIADVVGNRAVEKAGHVCSDIICETVAAQSLFPLCMVSPGYGRWDVSAQQPLFSLLDPAPVGIHLNEYCMMQPKKSLSFLIPFGDTVPERKLEDSCRQCTFKNCAYRRRT